MRIFSTENWELLGELEDHLEAMAKRIRERILAGLGEVAQNAAIGTILGCTIYLEIGDVARFPTAAHLA